jgi:alpha-tubulin suppressor-like RCC1 family protein
VRALAAASLVLLGLACQAPLAGAGATCTRNGECATGTCEFGRCRVSCRVNRDCGPGASCLVAADGTGACGLDVDLGCESGVGRTCASGLVCVADRCERSCMLAADCPSDGECRAASSGGAMFCFDVRDATDAAVVDAPPADGAADAGAACAVQSACFQRTGAACALDCTGRVWCWGQQHGGRLGNGVLDGPALVTPTLVLDDGAHPVTDVDSLACGDGFSCVHVAQGSSIHAGHVLCWGYDGSGAFDDTLATATDLTTPIVGSSVEVAAATRHACAVDHDTGDVLCWGENDALIDLAMPDGQLFAAPVAPIGGVHGVSRIALAAYGACVVLAATGEVRCWGDNALGQAGHMPIDAVTGEDPTVALTAVQTSTGTLAGVTQLAVGIRHRAVLVPPTTGDGSTLLTWGGNLGAELGESLSWTGEACDDARMAGSTCRSRAQTPGSAPRFTGVATSGDASTTCGVLAASHHVLCWGDNLHSNAGQPAGGRAWIARDDEVLVESTHAELDGVRDDGIFVGAENACAVRVDGTLWCWGANVDGQLARDPDASFRLAVPITIPP